MVNMYSSAQDYSIFCKRGIIVTVYGIIIVPIIKLDINAEPLHLIFDNEYAIKGVDKSCPATE